MPPTATPKRNAGEQRWEVVRERGRLRGTKWFLVREAPGFADVHGADGLPATGDPFDAQFPLLKAARYTPFEEPGRWGVWHMRVDYLEDDDSGVTPSEGLRVTTSLEQSRTTETVDADVTLTNRLTHDGSGVPKLVNAMTLRVLTFSRALPDITPLVELSDAPKVNSTALVLPNFLGSDQPMQVQAGQLLYAGFRPTRQGEFFVIEHELMLRRSWKHIKYPVDADGLPSGGVAQELDMYESADFVAVIGGGP